MTPCPVCGLEGGFHDIDNKVGKHAQHQVPRELLLESGWAKEAHDQLRAERTEALAAHAAGIDEDKQQWVSYRGLPFLVKGTRPVERLEVVIADEEGA